MIPVVTPAEMAAIDAAAPEPVDVLIDRAGAAVARAALAMLGGAYGRRVVVVAGKGNNGNDGRVAAARLARRGVVVQVVDAAAGPRRLPPADLVVDAAYGTGFRGTWQPPEIGDAPVLAVDIPSGVAGGTGEVSGPVLAAQRTVTFAALKPGLVFEPGRSLAGVVEVADIGLDTSAARVHLVEDSDVASWVPRRPLDAHKWRAAVWIVAGSPGMGGAAVLASRAAQRAGAGMIRLGSPGRDDPGGPIEVVGRALPGRDWARVVLAELDRFHALAVGPGLGRDEATAAGVRELLAAAAVPAVVDGDGLAALGRDAKAVLGDRVAATVLTPHDGEFGQLTGERPGADRLAAARQLAAETTAVVLLKGPSTVVAEPGGRCFVAAAGDARLATAGSGDVLTGIVAALLARGVPALAAAAAAAHVHGRAACRGPAAGLVASDLVDVLPEVLGW